MADTGTGQETGRSYLGETQLVTAGAVVAAGNPLPIQNTNTPAPPGTSVANSSGNVAAGVATATLPAAAGKTTYITGFAITGLGATAGSAVQATITNLLGGTLTFNVAVPAGVLVGLTPLVVAFPTPLPASAANTTIVVSSPSFGSGNTAACVSAWGFQL